MNAGDPQRWGTAVLAGRPNVGKSTLLNALAGRKLSIVTPKAQTTRHRIEGEVAGPGFRMILADTPGAGAAAGSRLAHFMNREGEAALDSADVAILVVSAPRWTDGDSAHLEAELPGLALENLEVLVTGSELTLKGERRITTPEVASWHRRERPSGRFIRTIALPWEIDAGNVEAKLRDGVLTIRLPKAESAKPKRVKLQSA